MCGGSANSRCFPSTVNGERTNPTASRPPRARVAARARIEWSPVGASRPMPWAVPPLWVRFPLPGDRFHPLGAPGSKALSRFLADVGVPREDRGRVPLVLAGDELVWVAGIRPCQERRVRPDTEVRLRLALHVPALAVLPIPGRAGPRPGASRLPAR